MRIVEKLLCFFFQLRFNLSFSRGTDTIVNGLELLIRRKMYPVPKGHL